ncbi:MAG: hypothetical protein ACRC1W_12805 [Shewanella sp.]
MKTENRMTTEAKALYARLWKAEYAATQKCHVAVEAWGNAEPTTKDRLQIAFDKTIEKSIAIEAQIRSHILSGLFPVDAYSLCGSRLGELSGYVESFDPLLRRTMAEEADMGIHQMSLREKGDMSKAEKDLFVKLWKAEYVGTESLLAAAAALCGAVPMAKPRLQIAFNKAQAKVNALEAEIQSLVLSGVFPADADETCSRMFKDVDMRGYVSDCYCEYAVNGRWIQRVKL